jgi:hypothetical protein
VNQTAPAGVPLGMRTLGMVGTVGATLVVVAAGACGVNVVDGRGGRPGRDERVLLSSDRAVLAVATSDGATHRFAGGVASADRSTVVAARSTPIATAVTAADANTGAPRWTAVVDGVFGVRVVARDGSRAALAPGAGSSTSYPLTGRATTTLLVVWAKTQQRFDLAGNFEPEAFTIDGRGLVLIEYLPAAAPTRYTIRLLDLRTGAVGRIPDKDGNDRQPMRGTARTSVMSPDGRRLYTYYAAPGGTLVHGSRFPAFVHVLDLAGRWAHCVGLAAPFGSHDVGIGISPDGGTVVVADAQAGAIAELDTQAVGLRRIARIAPVAATPGTRPSVAVGTNAVYIGAGLGLHAYDRRWLTRTATWTSSVPVEAVRLDTTEHSLFAALPGTVVALQPRRLTFAHSFTVPDAVNVQSADPATRPFDGGRDVIKCAC